MSAPPCHDARMRPSDEQLSREIATKIANDTRLSADAIKVTVDDGVVEVDGGDVVLVGRLPGPARPAGPGRRRPHHGAAALLSPSPGGRLSEPPEIPRLDPGATRTSRCTRFLAALPSGTRWTPSQTTSSAAAGASSGSVNRSLGSRPMP